MIEIEEKRLLKKAAVGDADAFELLVLKYQMPIYNLCFRMTGNAEDAADMTQEAFLKAWKGLSSFQFESAFSTWLYRLASNTCLDYLRALRRRPQVSLTVEDNDREEQVLDIPDATPTPEETLVTAEEQRLLSEALALLEVEQRQIIVMRVVNELSYAEISSVLGIKEGTVKSRLARARENLRKKLQQLRNKPVASASK